MSSAGAFDWDQDFDTLVHAPSRIPRSHALDEYPARIARTGADAAVTRAQARPEARAVSPLRSWVRSSVPFVAGLVIGLGAAWLATDRMGLIARPGTAHAPSALTMPAGLVTYDQSQFDNFRAGIVGFSDIELRAYARRTLQDIRAVDNPMSASMLDALVLVRQEMDRRGLRTAADLPRVH